MDLVSVYRVPNIAPNLLYKLLEERDQSVNISHRRMPSWDEHLGFIASRPYGAWYLIRVSGVYVGAIYLSKQDEIGIFVLSEHRGKGYGPQAIEALMARHPRPRFLANINPANERSIDMFGRLGFHLIQHTYELRPQSRPDGKTTS